MGRLAIIFLIISLVVNPEFRESAKPYAGWLLDPAYGWLTRSRVGDIARAIDSEGERGGQVPNNATLTRFLNEYFGVESAGVDAWGTRYFLTRDMWTTRVASAGPDRTIHTADDIRSAPLHTIEY
jgi:hypothetical protein